MCCVIVCDLETSRIRTPYIYDISHLRVKRHQLQPKLRKIEFNVHGSVHRNNILIYISNKMQRCIVYFILNNFFPVHGDCYEIMWKDMVQPDRTQLTIYYVIGAWHAG
jgi:hypothetical protein